MSLGTLSRNTWLGLAVSAVLHLVLLWALQPVGRVLPPPADRSLAVSLRLAPLQLRLLADAPVTAAVAKVAKDVAVPLALIKAPRVAPVNPSVTLPPALERAPVSEPLANPDAAPSLSERALASVGQVERQLRLDADRNKQLIQHKPIPPNLAKLPAPIQTAIAQSFERELGELVILNTETTQEGGDRVTRVYTNKGVYCVKIPLVRSATFRGMPTVATAGSCGP